MSNWLGGTKRRATRIWMSGLATGAALVVAVLVGLLLGRGWGGARYMLPEIPLHAVATHGSDSMAIATGAILDSEGLFVLDYITGELMCFVINPRANNQFNAQFRANVVQVLGVEQGKKPKYVMVTGAVNFIQGSAMTRPSNAVVYVCDTNTGNFACWVVPWNRNRENIGAPQAGELRFLAAGKARNVALEQAAP